MLLEIVKTVAILCLIYVFFRYFKHIWKIRSFPPGPFPLPLIGNAHSILGEPLHLWASEMTKKYGNVFSFSLGMERIVIINSINPMVDTLIKRGSSFAGRPTNNFFMEMFSRGFNDIAFSDYGEMWKNRRKLGHTALSMINDDRGNTESKIITESHELHKRIRRNEGKPVNTKKELGTCIINILLNVLFNIRFNPGDEELIELINMNDQIISSFAFHDPIAWMRWLRHIYPSENYMRLKDAIAKRDKYLAKYLKEHLETYREGLRRDFTDYLIEISRHNKDASVLGEGDLEMILSDMIVAGSDTTLTSLEWILLYLIHWPEYQDKLLKDIIKNTDNGRYPSLKDRPNLHFVQAFIHEALRFSSFVPNTIPHKTVVDEQVDSYKIPKETVVFYNIWAIHHQEEVFPEPMKFKPRRWLDKDDHFQRSKSFMLFSAGKRTCMGENLARKEIFLFLTRLVRDFKILPEHSTSLPELDGVIGGTISPKPFNVIFESRKE